MEIGRLARDGCQYIINLVINRHVLFIAILDHKPRVLAERHLPIAIERAAGIDADGEGSQWRVFSPTAREEIADRALNGRIRFVIPINTQDGMPPVPGGGHPNLFNSAGPGDVGKRECRPRLDVGPWARLSTPAPIPRPPRAPRH